MFRKPVTRSGFFRGHYLIVAIFMVVAGIGFEHPSFAFWPEPLNILAMFIVTSMTFPMNLAIAYVYGFIVEDLLAGYAIQPIHIFVLNVLALSALLINSWLWAFICLRNSAAPVSEAPDPTGEPNGSPPAPGNRRTRRRPHPEPPL